MDVMITSALEAARIRTDNMLGSEIEDAVVLEVDELQALLS